MQCFIFTSPLSAFGDSSHRCCFSLFICIKSIESSCSSSTTSQAGVMCQHLLGTEKTKETLSCPSSSFSVFITNWFSALASCGSCVRNSLQMNMEAAEPKRKREREHKKHGKKINRKLRKIQKNKLQSSRGGGRAWGDRRVDAARGKSRGKTWKHCRETCSL